jgi:hypothetical protein
MTTRTLLSSEQRTRLFSILTDLLEMARHYNTVRPHGSLGYKAPAPEVFLPAFKTPIPGLPSVGTPKTLEARPSMH